MGYRGPNGIIEDVPENKQNLILVVQIPNSEDEPVTSGIPYNFVVLNSPVTGHVGKPILLVITPDSIIIPIQMPIFIQITWRLGFIFCSACLASYYLFIYII